MHQTRDLRAEERNDQREHDQLALDESEVECNRAAQQGADDHRSAELPRHGASRQGGGSIARHDRARDRQRQAEREYNHHVGDEHDAECGTRHRALRAGLGKQGQYDGRRMDDRHSGEQGTQGNGLDQFRARQEGNVLPDQQQCADDRQEGEEQLTRQDRQQRLEMVAQFLPAKLGAS